MKTFPSVLILVCVIGLSACKEELIPIPAGLLVDQISSAETGDDYLLRIHVPADYEVSQLSYPVLYQLDGETTTGSVLKSYQELVNQEAIEELIIVSIDYVHDNKRTRDYTPTTLDQFDESGGAHAFFQFLDLELIPYIDQNYRTTSSNTLRGHSLGGLFASYALFTSSTLSRPFESYIIESPSWWWDDNFVIGQEYAYSEQHSELNAHVYFSVGEYEPASMKGPFELIRDRMLQRNYDGLRATFEILPDQDHLDVRENHKGLLEIFGK